MSLRELEIDHVKVNDSMKVKGKLNCGDKSVVQHTSPACGVKINSASGSITTVPFDISQTITFTVYNEYVSNTSIVILTGKLQQDNLYNIIGYHYYVSNIKDGKFNITYFPISLVGITVTLLPVTINFLVC